MKTESKMFRFEFHTMDNGCSVELETVLYVMCKKDEYLEKRTAEESALSHARYLNKILGENLYVRVTSDDGKVLGVHENDICHNDSEILF